jgi:tripartite-type tricarboxylate transporter receptor subunit TctC
MRRTFLKQVAALSASIAASPLAFSQADWPSRPIKLLVPYPPGGALDPIARILAPKVGALLGQPIVIENRPGANTAIAAGAVSRAEPDGYTLLFTSAATHVIHTIQAPRGYDSVKGFTPVAAVSRGDYMMTINASVPAKNLQEFIAYGRANPGLISAGAAGAGNADHLAAELFKLATGINLTSIPYKGAAPALLDLVAGRVQMMITTQSLMQPQVDAGKLRIMAYTYQPTDKPAVPTFAQAGLQGFETFGLLNIVLAPPDTPAPIVAKLSGALQRVLEMPETKASIAAVNQSAFYMPPAALRERLVGDSVKFADIIQKADIKFD